MMNFLMIGISASLMGSFLCRRAAGLFNSNYNHQTLYLFAFHLAIAVAFVCQTAAVILAVLGVSYKGFTANNLAGCFLIISAVVDVSQTVAIYLLLRKRFDGNLTSVRGVLTTAATTASYTTVLTLLGAITAVAWPQDHVLTSNVRHRPPLPRKHTRSTEANPVPRAPALLQINCSFVLPLTSLYALSLVVTLSSRKPRVTLVVGSTLAAIASGEFRDVHTTNAQKSEDHHHSSSFSSDLFHDDEDDEGLDVVQSCERGLARNAAGIAGEASEEKLTMGGEEKGARDPSPNRASFA